MIDRITQVSCLNYRGANSGLAVADGGIVGGIHVCFGFETGVQDGRLVHCFYPGGAGGEV